MKRVAINVLIVFFVTIFFPASSYATSFGPEDSQSPEILNIRLNIKDLPTNSNFRSRSTLRDLQFAGWLKSQNVNTWSDLNPGLSESWSVNSSFFNLRYGLFPSDSEAQFGVTSVIELTLGADSDPVTKQLQTSFSGQFIGDKIYSWHSDMEKQYGKFKNGPNGQPYPSEYAGLAFSKGNYGVSILAGIEVANGHIDKNLIETLAQKTATKIAVSQSLNQYSIILPELISNQGILRSLQVKLDHFIKNYRQGDYKGALNNINSFINELNAQRGKHVSESAYQTLKGYADTIIQSLNALM